MKFLLAVLLFLGQGAWAGVVDDPFADSPIEVRIVQMVRESLDFVLYDSNGTRRLSFNATFLTNEGADNFFYYYNGRGIRVASGNMSKLLHEKLTRFQQIIRPTCPLHLKLDRLSLDPLDMKFSGCQNPETISYVITKGSFNSNSSMALGITEEGFKAVEFYLYEGASEGMYYHFPLLGSPKKPLSREVAVFVSRALRSVSTDCPLKITIDGKSYDLLKVSPSCDIYQ